MKTCLLLFLCLLLQKGFAQQTNTTIPGPGFKPLQVNVSLPLAGAVYQRNAQNKGKIRVIGTYNGISRANNTSTVDGWLTKLHLQSGNSLGGPLINIDVAEDGPCFQGEVEVDAGWYLLTVEVKTYVPGSSQLLRAYRKQLKVGVGDVYLIAGQSNAQGLPASIAPDTDVWDGVRVSPLRFQEATFSITDPTSLPGNKQMYISSMDRATGGNDVIGPLGNSAWYWASVGQKLIQQYQVPVAFHNVAWGGTTISNWAGSINPQAQPLGSKIQRNGDWIRYNAGAPFGMLKNAVNFYASTYGLRAVLWMQGETDNQRIRDNTQRLNDNPVDIWQVNSASEYATFLSLVINETRQVLQQPAFTLPWVVARTSYNEGTVNATVIAGQNLTISSANKVYPGPQTDNIVDTPEAIANGSTTKRRTDNVHLKDQGLNEAAQLWFNAIRDNGVMTSVPVTPQDLNTMPVCSSIYDGQVHAPQASSYQWVLDDGNLADLNTPVNFGQTIPVNLEGQRRAVLRNAQGLYVLSQSVDLPFTYVDDTQSTEGGLPTNTCYTINVDQTGKRLQAMGDNSVQQQTISNDLNQIWRLDDRGNGALSFTSQDGSNRVIQSVGTPVESAAISLGGYTGTNQHWVIQANPSSTNQYRVFSQATNNTWDLQNFANYPHLQVYGNTGESFFTHRSFRFEPTGCSGPVGGCNFTLAPNSSDNNPNRSCGQAVALNANCSGSDCGSVTYSWSGNGISGSGSSIAFNVPGSNGNYIYTVTASKAGCNPSTSSVTLNVSGCNPGSLLLNSCYTINVDQTGKRLQAMGDNSVQQQTISNDLNQIWRLDDRGNGQVSFTSQDGTGRVIQSVGTPVESAGISLGGYTGTNQQWALQSNPSSTTQYRVYSSATNNTWDLQNFANYPHLQVYGNTGESFFTHRSFRFEPTGCAGGGGGFCNFALAASIGDGNPNRSCGQAVTLNANCSGSDCGSVTYSWSGNGINGSGSSIAFNVPGTNGNYVYTVTASKSGCSPYTSSVTLNVSGCSGTDPCAAYTAGTQVAYRSPNFGDPSLKIVVSDVGGCKRAVWSDGSGAVNRDWLPYVTANPGFNLTDVANCLKFSDEPCGGRRGLAESATSLELVVAPNPSNGQFTVRFQTKAGQAATLRLVDLSGRAVRAAQSIMGTGQLHEEPIKLPASVHGVLLLEVISGQQRSTRKILID